MFCSKCGKELQEGVAVCPECGAVLREEKKEVGNEEMVMGIFAYLSILVLVPLFLAKDSKAVRFHTNQGLILLILEVVWSVVSTIAGWILSLIGLGFLGGIMEWVNLIFIPFMVIGIIHVVKGEEKELPYIGQFKILS